jgi:V/A-type H+-transporting ATPase subunit D
MPDNFDVTPTKGTLLRLQGQLALTANWLRLLQQKQEVLLRELTNRLGKVAGLAEKMLRLFRAAHEQMQIARLRMGTNRIERIIILPTTNIDVKTTVHTIMGLRIPVLKINIQAILPPYSLSATSAALDEARELWIDVIRFLGEEAETFASIWRLTAEVNKIKRQVNALEHRIIPRYRNTIRLIAERLEESEREDLIDIKSVISKNMQRSSTE